MSSQKRRKMRRTLATASGTGSSLVLAAPGEQTVDTEQRTISGLVVPYGKPGETSGGRLKFAKGSLTVSEPRRVKLLREHDQRDVIGYATELTETDEGMVGTFHVPEGDNGDRALAEARNGLRDAFSVGVQLDDATLQRLRRTQPGGTVDAKGQLREVSQVSVPAFDDARVAAAAGADLVVSRWDTTPMTTSAAGAGNTTGGSMEFTGTITGEVTGTVSETEPATETDESAAAAGTASAAATLTTASHATAGGTPTVVPAVAGAARVTGEPSPYTFGAEGPSLVRDMFAAAVHRDSEAAERVERFNAQLRDGNAAATTALVTAAATRDDVDGAGTDLPTGFGGGTQWRPDLMRQVLDPRRPFLSRVRTIPITNAQPFAIPTVGEFTGVGEHTEGTPHRPAGTLALGGSDVIQPTATSGAWEVSRELLDAANPALDAIAVRAMLRDYARQTEGKMLALFSQLALDQGGADVYGVDGVMALRQALLAFVNDDEEAADIVGVSKGLLGTLMADVDTTDRAQIPFYAPVNSVAQTGTAGYTAFTIDGVPVFRAARLDSAANLGATYGVIARSESLIWAESQVQQFRFDEVLGPGVIKFALWGYSGAGITDTNDVQLIASGADPTP